MGSSEPSARPPSGRALQLLLIDDNPRDRELLARELKQHFTPLHIETARDALEFDQVLSGSAFEAVVVDYQIRWSTGLDVLRAVKRARPGCPVLMFTASGSEEIAVQAMKEGLDDYVTKTAKHYARLPYALGAVLERIEQKRALERAGTAHSALSQRLHQGQQWMHMALQAARMLAWELDVKEGRLTVSADCEEIMGRRWEHLSDLFNSLPRAESAKLRKLLKRAQSHGEPFTLEVRFVHPRTEQEGWLELRGQPLRAPDGPVERFVGIAADVSARKRALIASAHLAAIVESSQDAIVSHDMNGIVTSWNEGATLLYGYSASEMLGQPITRLLPPERIEEHEQILSRLRHGERIGNYESQRIAKGGHRMAVSITVSLIRDPGGQVLGASTVARDITAAKRIEEELRLADQRKDQLIATLAHELRNPLAPIRYATQLLKPGVPPEMAEDARRMIDRQLAHMARLLDELLDASRITRGVIQIEHRVLDLTGVIESAVAAVRPLTQPTQLTLEVQLQPLPLMVSGDAARLEEVISNLLHNAIKYTNPGGHISVQASLEDAEVVTRVRDDGIGIPAPLLPQIFEIFVQAEPTGSRAAGGLGVGLAVARELVHLHGGRIEARSEGPGKGSEFVVRLPCSPEQPALTQTLARPERITALGASSTGVLIVDDNQDAADTLAQILNLAGFKTRVAYDALQALALAATEHPDVMLVDIGLPNVSGHELARRLRQEPWGAALQLIAVTGWGQANDRRKSLEAGFDEHLTKPVEPERLLGLLQRARPSAA